MSFFQNRVAVITGAASGIGRALALELAQRGARVAISDIDSAGLRVTEGEVLEFGAECLAFDMDVANHESFREFRDLILSRFERVDLLFNNAGVALRSSVEETSREDFDWLMRINFWGGCLRNTALPGAHASPKLWAYHQYIQRLRHHRSPNSSSLQCF